jgi:hypothetical protein
MGTIIQADIKDMFAEDFDSNTSVSQSLIFKMAAILQGIKEGNTEALGTIETSLLTEAHFQTLKSNAWVLMRKQDITNTDYGQYLITNNIQSGTILAPDGRGMHLVGVNESRNDGNEHHKNPLLGGFVSGETKAHTHYMFSKYTGGSFSGGTLTSSNSPVDANTNYNIASKSQSATIGRTSSIGQAQNTVHAIGVNYYIKVWNVSQ